MLASRRALAVAGVLLACCVTSTAAVCETTKTETLKWAEGADIASKAGTASDAACYAFCEETGGCDLSIRDPANGNCYLKAKSPLLTSLDLSTTYCVGLFDDAEPVCETLTTETLKWAEGADIASRAGTASDEACYAFCEQTDGCDLSTRDPANGNCFLKAKSPLLESLDLSTTYCAGLFDHVAACANTTTETLTWADGPDIASRAGTTSDAACYTFCEQTDGCELSVRDPANGNCFLKAKSQLLESLDLSTTYCEGLFPSVFPKDPCVNLITKTLKWAEGADIASIAGTRNDVECWAECEYTLGCDLSIRDSETGNCFLKAKSPLLESLGLTTTYCAGLFGEEEYPEEPVPEEPVPEEPVPEEPVPEEPVPEEPVPEEPVPEEPVPEEPVPEEPVPETLCTKADIPEAVAATNVLRARVGVEPVVCLDSLSQIAEEWSQGMCDDAIAKANPGGTLTHGAFGDRVQTWKPRIEGTIRWASENVLYNFNTENEGQAAITQWENSSGHYANIIYPDVNRVGLAYVRCPLPNGFEALTYWTQVFIREV